MKMNVIYDAIGMKEETFNEKANAELFADALNTLRECESIPSEILRQRNELIEWAKTVINDSYSISRIKELLNSIHA